MNYQPFVPESPPLAGAVEVIFCLEDYSPAHGVERLVPNGRLTLVIELDGRARHVYDNVSRESTQVCRNAWLSGVHHEHLTIGEVGPATRLAAVQFAPGRALPLIHQPLERFNDRVVPAERVFGSSILELRERLVAAADANAVLAGVAAWLSDRWRPEYATPEVVGLVVDRLLVDPARVALTRLVAEHGSVTYKHFVELFKRHVGPAPKTLQRILRFARIFEEVQGRRRVDWAGLSRELGYSDQAHLVRDFAAFSGYRPSEFLELGSERLNFFPDDGT